MVKRIYEEIEATADYYDPSLYHHRLTQSHSLEVAADAFAQDFIPLSTVPVTADARLKLFVIGLIPPAAEITGNTLDRSRSIASLEGGGEEALQLPPVDSGSLISPRDGASLPNVPYVTGTPGENMGPPNYKTYSREQIATAIREAYRKQNGGRDPTLVELAMYTAHAFTENSGKLPNNNFGYIGNLSKAAAEKSKRPTFYNAASKRYFYSYQSLSEGATYFLYNIRGPAREAARAGDADAYAQALKDQRYYQEPVSKYQAALHRHLEATRFIDVGTRAGTTDPTLPVAADSASGGPGWKEAGAKAANNAQQQVSQGARSNLNSTLLGQKFAAAQVQMAAYVNSAIHAMKNTPPLRMLVNPSSFKVGNEKIVSDGNWSRTGPIVEQWGDGQDTIEASGKIGAFYCADVFDSNGPGLNRTARTFSAAYQNFLSLYQIYRNNAGIYIPDEVDPHAGKMNLVMSGSVYIYFDNTMYIGSFDSFSVTEADTAPFTLEYSFQFTVRATFILDEVPDPKRSFGITSLDVNNQEGGSVIRVSSAAPEPRPDQKVPLPSERVDPEEVQGI